VQLPEASQLMHEFGCCCVISYSIGGGGRVKEWVRRGGNSARKWRAVDECAHYHYPSIHRLPPQKSTSHHSNLNSPRNQNDPPSTQRALARKSWRTKRTFSTTAGLCVWMRWPSFTCFGSFRRGRRDGREGGQYTTTELRRETCVYK
jgi:hypothetical protein